MVRGVGPQAEDCIEALKTSYATEIYDEKFVPTVITENGEAVAKIADNDAVIFFNFRPDRMRQISKAFVADEFDLFDRSKVNNVFFLSMAEYEKGLGIEVVFPPQVIKKCIAEIISEKGIKQLHIAETEKYAHVTFFLNGTKEKPFEGEDRIIIPSPKVSSYDQVPEMSARELTDRVVGAMRENKYGFFAINFANPDMIGHTGIFDAAVKGVEVVDESLGRIVEEALSRNGYVFITADHGNAEELKNLRTGDMNKAHATNPVPFLIIGNEFRGQSSIAGEVPGGDLSLMSPVGMLADVAPTILAVLGIDQPEEMTGVPLI